MNKYEFIHNTIIEHPHADLAFIIDLSFHKYGILNNNHTYEYYVLFKFRVVIWYIALI